MSVGANGFWQDGERAVKRGEWDAAARSFISALRIDEKHVPSRLGLSTVYSRLGRHRDARDQVIAAYRAKPVAAPLIFAVAQKLRYFNDYEALVDCLGWPEFGRQAPPQALAEAAVSLSTIGANEQATALVEHALRLDPKHAPALYFRGNLHTFSGEFERAEECYEASLRSDPGMFQASWMLSSLAKQTSASNHIARLREQELKATKGRRGEVYVAYALHKELHDLGEYDQAWRALENGCKAERALSRYDGAATSRMFDALEEVCSEAFVQEASEVSGDVTPIFIVGMFRSGTSLLERMLSGHHQVTDGGETLAFSEQLKRAANLGFQGVLDTDAVAKLRTSSFVEIGAGYAETLRWLAKGRPFVTEKLPSNFLNIGFIAKAYPQARFVHLVRDPMDTCFANLRTLFSEVAAYSYDQRDMGEYFNRYRTLMEHWKRVLPGRVLDVHYSELVTDTEVQVRRVAKYCGLPFVPDMLDVGRGGGAVVTASATQVRQGVVKDRGGAWRPYAAHLGVLSELVEKSG